MHTRANTDLLALDLYFFISLSHSLPLTLPLIQSQTHIKASYTFIIIFSYLNVLLAISDEDECWAATPPPPFLLSNCLNFISYLSNGAAII